MNNQQHPFINALGGNPSNIHILDNMFIQQADHGGQKTTIIPQYTTAYQEISNAMTHHHAMNLVATPVQTVASTIDAAALYQNEQAQQQQQQQPISYKVPQAVAVVQEQPVQMSISIPERKKPINTMPPHVKDIVAEAMREVEESNQKKQQAAAAQAQLAAQQRQQQEQHLLAQRQITVATIPQLTHATAIAIKSEPHVAGIEPQQHHIIQHQHQQIIHQEEPRDVKPNIAAVDAASMVSKGEPVKPTTATTPKPGTSGMTPTSQTQTRTYNRSQPRTQIMPRLQLLDDEDDGLTCRLCLQTFWYRSHLNEHLGEAHSITDPSKYEREEREKKLRRIREEQQRIAMSKRQRLMQMGGRGGLAARGRGGMLMGRGAVRGGLRPGMPGGRPMPTGPRPSFQYRDGAFICDLCKKSFSDGNDMVAHWKSHVKQQAKTMRGNAVAAAAVSAREQKNQGQGNEEKNEGKTQNTSIFKRSSYFKKECRKKRQEKAKKRQGKASMDRISIMVNKEEEGYCTREF